MFIVVDTAKNRANGGDAADIIYLLEKWKEGDLISLDVCGKKEMLKSPQEYKDYLFSQLTATQVLMAPFTVSLIRNIKVTTDIWEH